MGPRLIVPEKSHLRYMWIYSLISVSLMRHFSCYSDYEGTSHMTQSKHTTTYHLYFMQSHKKDRKLLYNVITVPQQPIEPTNTVIVDEYDDLNENTSLVQLPPLRPPVSRDLVPTGRWVWVGESFPPSAHRPVRNHPHCSHLPRGTQFCPKWGPNGDPIFSQMGT